MHPFQVLQGQAKRHNVFEYRGRHAALLIEQYIPVQRKLVQAKQLGQKIGCAAAVGLANGKVAGYGVQVGRLFWRQHFLVVFQQAFQNEKVLLGIRVLQGEQRAMVQLHQRMWRALLGQMFQQLGHQWLLKFAAVNGGIGGHLHGQLQLADQVKHIQVVGHALQVGLRVAAFLGFTHQRAFRFQQVLAVKVVNVVHRAFGLQALRSAQGSVKMLLQSALAVGLHQPYFGHYRVLFHGDAFQIGFRNFQHNGAQLPQPQIAKGLFAIQGCV